MPGGEKNIIVEGNQNVILNGNPTKTFFTSVYKKYTNFGKQKLFMRVSPNKTVEGFLGGLFFCCICSIPIAKYLNELSFTNWLIIAIIISVFGLAVYCTNLHLFKCSVYLTSMVNNI